MNEEVLVPEVFGCLQKAMANDPSGLAELCRDYLAEARDTLKLLRQDLAAGDFDGIRNHAHYLKGGSQVIGTKVIAQCCTALEDASKRKDPARAHELVDAVAIAIDAAQTEIGLRIGRPMNPAGKPAA
jgi:HPt (histidine-containing phosphotransfer) domain-containing protein